MPEGMQNSSKEPAQLELSSEYEALQHIEATLIQQACAGQQPIAPQTQHAAADAVAT